MGTGGYQSVPVCLAAALLRIPVAVLEPNAAPGLANRLLAPLCAAAFVGFPESRALLRARRAVVSGCPVRRAVAAAGEERGKRERGGTRERRRGERTRVLVVGGSLGAAVLTEAAVGAAEIMEWEESGRVGMVVQTGKGRAREAQRLAGEMGSRGPV